MEDAELRRRIGEILKQEERPDVDWEQVESLSLKLHERLGRQSATEVPDAVFHFLDDADIRRKDEAYAARQRDLVRRYVDTGQMVEHAKSVPWWSCLLTLAVPAVLLLWWLL
jgi:hypothetical protein